MRKSKDSFRRWSYLYLIITVFLVVVIANISNQAEANTVTSTSAREVWPDNYKVIWLPIDDACEKKNKCEYAIKKGKPQLQIKIFNAKAWYKKNKKNIVVDRIIKNYGNLIKMISERVDVDIYDLIVIPTIESNGRKTDINNQGGSEEECIYQVKPETAKDVEERFNVNFKSLNNRWDCVYAGAGTFKIYFEKFKNLDDTYVAYNRGIGTVSRLLLKGIDPTTTSNYDDKAAYIKMQLKKMNL